MPQAGLKPNAVVIGRHVRALKNAWRRGQKRSRPETWKQCAAACHLQRHLENMAQIRAEPGGGVNHFFVRHRGGTSKWWLRPARRWARSASLHALAEGGKGTENLRARDGAVAERVGFHTLYPDAMPLKKKSAPSPANHTAPGMVEFASAAEKKLDQYEKTALAICRCAWRKRSTAFPPIPR